MKLTGTTHCIVCKRAITNKMYKAPRLSVKELLDYFDIQDNNFYGGRIEYVLSATCDCGSKYYVLGSSLNGNFIPINLVVLDLAEEIALDIEVEPKDKPLHVGANVVEDNTTIDKTGKMCYDTPKEDEEVILDGMLNSLAQVDFDDYSQLYQFRKDYMGKADRIKKAPMLDEIHKFVGDLRKES